LAAIQEEIDPNNIEYIIANHTEPDHSALIPDLLQLAPNATVVGSKVCIQFLQNLVLRPFKSKILNVFSSIHQMHLSSVLHIGVRMKVI
jgi:flavorubredoxin